MLSIEALSELMQRFLPPVDHRGEEIESISEDRLRMRLPARVDYLSRDLPPGSGRTLMSGPVMMGFADTALYACIHASYGAEVLAVIVNFNVSFLSAAGEGDLKAEARILRKGRSLAFVEAHLYSGDSKAACAQITATYAIRPIATPLREG